MLRSLQTSTLVVALLACGCAAAQTFTVAPELWDRPRSARAVLEQPAVQDAVRSYLKQPGRKLAVHHPASQEGLLYAEELRSWLIALAVEGDDVVLRADRHRGEPLTLELMQ